MCGPYWSALAPSSHSLSPPPASSYFSSGERAPHGLSFLYSNSCSLSILSPSSLWNTESCIPRAVCQGLQQGVWCPHWSPGSAQKFQPLGQSVQSPMSLTPQSCSEKVCRAEGTMQDRACIGLKILEIPCVEPCGSACPLEKGSR